MKEELLRVLNNKLDDINGDIDALIELNDKISNEEENLSYMSGILDLFGKEDKNVMKFADLSKDDFNKVLDTLGEDVKHFFETDSCNYDGLVYLINGINSGVSLVLTDEQKMAIENLIHKVEEKIFEYQAAIEGYQLAKERYIVNDVDTLKTKKESYLNVIDELDKKEYVSNTDLVLESINFSEVSDEDTIKMLKYLLEYNASVYENTDHTVLKEETSAPFEYPNEVKEDELPDFSTLNMEFEPANEEFVMPSEVKEENEEFVVPEEDNYTEFHFNNIDEDKIDNFEHVSFDEENEESHDEINYVPTVEMPSAYKQDDELEFNEELEGNSEEPDVRISTSDVQTLLNNYDIQLENAYINELVVGDNNYEEILNTLKEEKIIDYFKNNSELLIEILLYSDSETIKKVLDIIKKDLSVDKDDYEITTSITLTTIPSIFIKHNGNYDNFVQNIETFKDLELNLINLFDFSKELFVASHSTIVNNLEIVQKYDVPITYQNAKYLLLLENIGDRLDYYVESIYEDKEKGEIFDGLEYINLYTAKLNVVTSETIKRLRYCSENGKKLFGSKPKSLTGEITNLKVNSLDITGDYLDKFFDNDFAQLTGDEVREYTKLVHSSSNVGNYDDELDILEQYHNGLRYVIDGINISYNKVLRNYSILRSYGIDRKKALHFAVCYNLVITKEEYDKLKNTLDELGGNV